MLVIVSVLVDSSSVARQPRTFPWFWLAFSVSGSPLPCPRLGHFLSWPWELRCDGWIAHKQQLCQRGDPVGSGVETGTAPLVFQSLPVVLCHREPASTSGEAGRQT